MTATMEKFGITVTYDKETNQVITLVGPNATISFEDEQKLHPTRLRVFDDGITLTNVYAVDQQIKVRWAEGIDDMLVRFIQSPAAMYREIHNLGCADSIRKMRKVLATYITHLGRTDKADAQQWVTKYLRALTVIGNNAIATNLTRAIEDTNQHSAFIATMKPYLEPAQMRMNYIKMLELYFGQINREKVTFDTLKTLPLDIVETREAPANVQRWALDNEIVVKEQTSIR